MLFRSTAILSGSVIDSGAHTGGESCFLADLDQSRTVHAIEPFDTNLASLRDYVKTRPNIALLHGALGSVARRFELSSASHSRTMLHNVASAKNATSTSRHAVTVYRIDDRFAAERVAFMHLDVEGSEEDALLGATAVIERDRPIFTVETHMANGDAHVAAHASLLATLRRLRYRPHIVKEVCGVLQSCRNLIAVPLERVALLPPQVAALQELQH